jgi:hypothetical protein
MENRGDSGVVAVVIAVMLVLLLLGGGAGAYLLISRQQMALSVQAERDLVAEAMMAAERAHAEALLKTNKDQATNQIPGSGIHPACPGAGLESGRHRSVHGVLLEVRRSDVQLGRQNHAGLDRDKSSLQGEVSDQGKDGSSKADRPWEVECRARRRASVPQLFARREQV